MVNWWFVYQCMCTSELCMTMCGCVGTGLLACCHAQLGSTGRCFRFAFRIPTVFDMFPTELVRFRYPDSSFSCSFPTFPNSISFSYWNVKVKTILGLSRPSSTAFNPAWHHVLEDSHFLERCLLLDGVSASVSPCNLIQSILGVQTAVLVRDSQTGFRIGLLVFFDAIDSAAVTIQTPREGLYATCTPVSPQCHLPVILLSVCLSINSESHSNADA